MKTLREPNLRQLRKMMDPNDCKGEVEKDYEEKESGNCCGDDNVTWDRKVKIIMVIKIIP